MTEEGGRPPAAFEERGRSPATSGGSRTANSTADGWLGRLARTTANKSFTPQGTGAGPGPQGGLSSLTMLN